jgi:hypothetical protein
VILTGENFNPRRKISVPMPLSRLQISLGLDGDRAQSSSLGDGHHLPSHVTAALTPRFRAVI